ncbi:hypothetical protein EVAR_69197_1 [Eumeta japonica]|uniref:Uncharacterized protein n=1 Tax=Eumeta variegata TaxID=151549 RepID=A0A4C1T3T6_EUMVA|nr:hypothetical protein EVAR_69197_1 [Eumeta japonica]
MDDATSTTSTTIMPTFAFLLPCLARVPSTFSSTTTKAPTRPTTEVGKPFTRSSAFSASTNVATNQNTINRYDVTKLSKEIRTPAPAQGFKSPAPTTPTSKIDSTRKFSSIQIRPRNDGLEPPKLESPIGVDGREYPETVIDYNSISTNNGLTAVSQFGIEQSKNSTTQPKAKINQPSRSPTSRSVKEIGQPSSDLSVPEYAFPLENNGRTGYLDTDAYNSFLLKYPENRADTDQPLHWYGENPKCPECHPSYVIPGTCEPCIRR